MWYNLENSASMLFIEVITQVTEFHKPFAQTRIFQIRQYHDMLWDVTCNLDMTLHCSLYVRGYSQ